MRRKISLYIADQLVDLDDQSFILFNYTMDDLSNPTIVKNSFSQQITLKGTPANNKIFGGFFRTDRRVAGTGGETGIDFNASQKTPFTIYNEMGEIMESGYVKLDSISRQGADIQYKISLYGGFGSFLFSLSYDDNGNKRTLADLAYLDTGGQETELDFTINVASVQEAWARLTGDTSASEMWDVINFAPAYNGIPEGNFSPGKALVVPSEVGLQTTITNDGVDYTIKSGYAMINLAEAQDEWAVKDLRSYLQRPVFSMKAFFDAICNPANNGGYEVDASIIQDYMQFGKYASLWMTLPLISSIGTIKQESGDLSLTMSSSASSGNEIGRFDIVGSVPSGTMVTANINCKIRFNTPSGANAYTELLRYVSRAAGRNTYAKFTVIFIQAIAYGSDNSVVGGSKIKVFTPIGGRWNGASLASSCGYEPAWSADYETSHANTFTKVSAGVFEMPDEMGFSVTAQDVAYYKIRMSIYSGTYHATAGSGTPPSYSYSGDGSTSTPVLYADYDTGYTPNSTFIIQGETANTITYTTSDSLRSGAVITKSMLLSSSHTPAEYMLSFCKIFGLYFTYDVATKKVTILRRNDLYLDETIDLTRRVDVSRGISIQPLVFNAKWYDFILEGVGGAFYDEYLNVEGIRYGIQRVNTGYDFNADSINLMDSVVFKNACTILARSKYFNIITRQIEITDDLTTGLVVGKFINHNGNVVTNSSFSYKEFEVKAGDVINFTGTMHPNIAAISKSNHTTPATYTELVAATAQAVESFRYVATENMTIALCFNNNYSRSATLPGEQFIPSPFLDKGNTFTLWSSDGNTLETDISCPPASASVDYYNENPNYAGYDVNTARKLELRSADNKPIDGSDILVFLEGWDNYPYFKLTDDVPAMDVLNEGVPCWLLGAGAGTLRIPIFQRYAYGNTSLIEDSLDFGVPRQFDIPGVRHSDGCTIYERGWKNYISDRYDVNTKVMTCHVNFGGIQVSQELLRKFYWYDNSIWVLNKIKNYSLTTYDPVECEFVQVQDKSNYLNGQSY